MPDINATLPFLEPVAATLNILIDKIEYIVGGIFGLYIIMLLIRIYYSVRFLAAFKSIKKELKFLDEKITSMETKLNKLVKK